MSVKQDAPVFSIVSVIKNVTGREAMFRRSIESVLGQTWTDFEFVIQDGGSADGTADIVAEYHDPRIRFVSTPDASGEEGFFNALKRCRGTYIGSCLSDEELSPDALENARRAFEQHPRIAAFYGDVSYVNEKGEKWGPRVPPHPFLIEAYVCQILVPPFCSAFFRREAVEKAGLHEHHWRCDIGEFEFWIRVANVGEIIYQPYNISYFGRHSRSNTLSALLYDRLVGGRERVMADLFRENGVLQSCNVTVEQAIAGNYVWGASGVFNIEGASQKCEHFLKQAERHAPKSPQLARLKNRIRETVAGQAEDSARSPAVVKDTWTPPSGEFGRWLGVLSSMDNRLYYRDQSTATLAALCSLAHDFDPTVIVELGTLGGLSLRTWLAGTERARVVAIDLGFAKLAQTRKALPVDLSRVTCLEQDILKTDFASLWTAQDRVILFVDAHDLPNVPIMEYVLTQALPSLPEGSLVVVDDLWFSEQRLTRGTARAFLEGRVVEEIDELQCFNGHYAPYHEGGSFMGFAEIIPLLDFVNRHGIELIHPRGDKHVYFTWKKEYLSHRQETLHPGSLERDESSGAVLYNPLESVPVSEAARESMRDLAAAYLQGRTQQVAETVQGLVTRHPREQGLYYAFAVCLARRGQLSQARDVLQGGSTGANPPRYQRLLDDIVRRVGPSQSHQAQKCQTPTNGQGLTLFALPKPFAGDIATLQKNAIRSWTRLRPAPEIILFGDEPGTRQMAEEVGARHIPEISRNEFGTPLVNKLFETAEQLAGHDVIAYVNADIILFQDFVEAARKVRAGLSEFLLIGQRWDLPLFDEIDFDRPDWQQTLQKKMVADAMIHPESGLDYFVFRRGVWPRIPAFALGRTVWDSWLVADPNNRGVPVIDGTEAITAVHQDHDYAHLAGGRHEAWHGVEAKRNRSVAGPTDGLGLTSGATWILKQDGTLAKAQPRKPWCRTVPYKVERSAWLLKQAAGLLAIDKQEVAAAKCEEALTILQNLLGLKQGGSPQVRSRDAALVERYASGHVLLARCYFEMRRYDRVAQVCSQLLENPHLAISQAARETITQLRDQSARASARTCEDDLASSTDQTALGVSGSEPASSGNLGSLDEDVHREAAPKVSIVLACYDAERFLSECMDSIIGQTLPEWELHILDDGSKDGTRRIIEEYARRDTRIKPYVFSDNKGPYVRRNLAIANARSDFIVIQDADDLMCPNKLARLHQAITADDRLGIVGSSYRMFLDQYKEEDRSEDVMLAAEHTEIVRVYQTQGLCDFCWHGSAIIRKRLFEEIGFYDENPFGSDSFWLAKVAEYACRSDRIRLRNIADFLTLRRMRTDSQTGSLPSFDPRSRRARFRDYRRGMLLKVVRRLDSDPTADVKTELRRSVCNDFVARYGHLFEQWGSEPVTHHMMDRFVTRIFAQFTADQYIRCITTCEMVERMANDLPQTIRCYDLVRGLAYFAIGLYDRSRKYLMGEYDTHRTAVAKDFCDRYVNRPQPGWKKTDRAEIVRQTILNCAKGRREDSRSEAELTCVLEHRGNRTALSLIMECVGDVTRDRERIISLDRQSSKSFEVIVLAPAASASALAKLESEIGFDLVVLTGAEDGNRWRRKNAAAAHAHGSYVAFLGDRVQPADDFVEKTLRHCENESVDGLRGRILVASGRTSPIGYDLGERSVYAACDTDEACIFRKEVFDGLGGFQETPIDCGAIQVSCLIYAGERADRRPIRYYPDIVVRRDTDESDTAGVFNCRAIENRLCLEQLSRSGRLRTRVQQEVPAFLSFVESLYGQAGRTEDEQFREALNNSLFFRKRFPAVSLDWACQALRHQPQSLMAAYSAGVAHAALNRWSEASLLLERILAPIERQLATGRLNRGQSEFTDFTALTECFVAACTLLAECYLNLGRREQIIATYMRVLQNKNVALSEARRNEMIRTCNQVSRLPALPSIEPADAVPPKTAGHVASSIPTGPALASASRSETADASVQRPAPEGHVEASSPAKWTRAARLSELARRMRMFQKSQEYQHEPLTLPNEPVPENSHKGKSPVCDHRPSAVEFNITTKCHAGCIMCGYTNEGEVLALDRFKRIADGLLPTAQDVLLIGGEVLMHPDFYEICEYAHHFGVSLEMTTNLCMLEGRRAEAIERFFSRVKVSLDGATKQTYESIRTHLNFDRLLENLSTLSHIKQCNRRLKTDLTFVAMRRNIAELPATIELASRFGFDHMSVNFVMVPCALTPDESLLFHRELANRCFDEARKKADKLKLTVRIPSNFDLSQSPYWAPEKPTEGYKQCTRPWQRLRVLVSGEVVPCCHLHDRPMGNVLERPFEQIWNGPDYQRLREAIQSGGVDMPGRCTHCQLHSKRSDSNDAILHIAPENATQFRERLESAGRPHPRGNSRPKVTIITSCRDSEAYLGECIESVRKQTLQEWEMFLIDDGSRDGTRGIIERYARQDARIKPFCFDTNEGPYVRRNSAIERAGSDFVVIQDADDLMLPTKLEVLYREINQDSHLGVVGSPYRTFLEDFKGLQHTECHDLPAEHDEIIAGFKAWSHTMSHGSAIIRRTLFGEIGPYDANPFASDSFWLAKLANYVEAGAAVRVRNARESLTLIRMHATNQTRTLSVFDPRNRRVRFRQYCELKLRDIRKKMETSPGTDIGLELRRCNCSDFLTRFRSEIPQWESQPVNLRFVEDLLQKAVLAFNNRYYVSCVNLLNGVEGLEPTMSRQIMGFELLRGMALYALGMKGHSEDCLQREIQLHDNPAAHEFTAEAFRSSLGVDVQDWCDRNSRRLNIGLTKSRNSVLRIDGCESEKTANKDVPFTVQNRQ